MKQERVERTHSKIDDKGMKISTASVKKLIKAIFLWAVTIFFALMGLVYLTSGSVLVGVLASAVVVVVIPISGWQGKLKTQIKGVWKPIITIFLMIICFAVMGAQADTGTTPPTHSEHQEKQEQKNAETMEAVVPFASNEYQGRNYQEVVDELKKAGFENVEIETVLTYSESEADTVGDLTINGKHSFLKSTSYEPTAPVVVSRYKLNSEITVGITVDGEDGKPMFTIDTNLPDGTVLDVELSGMDDDNFDYFEQREITVQGGTAATEVFAAGDEPLTGAYYFGVVMFPAEQNEQVQEVIGAAGEYMRGDFLKTEGSYHYVMASTEYTSPVEAAIEKIGEVELQEKFKTALSGFGDDCEISVDGYVYTVNVWQDGLAQTTVLANAGFENAKKAWDSIVDTTTNACESLWELLAMNGYEDYMIQIQILNDQNRANTLLSVFMGIVSYNCVS